ncbi:MAG TPA: ABC transporter substrate-binding protein [Stellaceae bacterium]|jgi:NitT/TauT family transport system substrate-binding protein|nr:ABC transporter substrate-binding protein [Stellaceae bacterium]
MKRTVTLPAAPCLTILAALTLGARAEAADQVKVGVVKVAANGPNFIAKDRGYFAAEGIDAEILSFDSAEPITVAIVSGDIDFGATGPGAAFYNLAGQNKIRIISGLARDVPGFPVFTFVVSNQAYDAGFKTYAALGGHSISTTQVGAPSHYAINLIEQKFNVDPKTVRVVPLQSLPNQISATAGGQVDAGVVLATIATPAINRGALKLVGYVGDVTPIQTGALFTSGKHADQDQDLVKRFLRAFRKGALDYRNAFVAPDEKRRDGPDAAAILDIIAKYVGQSPEQLRAGISYIDAQATLDVTDIQRQLAWFKTQGMVKQEVRDDQVYDKRYVIPLAAQ